jgi:hypothetical protein
MAPSVGCGTEALPMEMLQYVFAFVRVKSPLNLRPTTNALLDSSQKPHEILMSGQPSMEERDDTRYVRTSGD